MTERAEELALGVYRALGCHGFARVDLMLERDTGELVGARGQRDPRADGDLAAPAGGRGGRNRLRRLVERMLEIGADARGGLQASGGLADLLAAEKSSGVTFSRKSLNFSTTSSVSSTSCSNSIADSAITSSAAKIGASARTASARASLGRESISTSRPLIGG